jgi:hypothetical protein
MNHTSHLNIVTAAKNTVSTGLANARRLVGRSGCRKIENLLKTDQFIR